MRVAVTGNMGSGKSTFARMLADLGARLVDADLVARRVVEESPALRRQLADAFGADLLTPQAELDRAELARRALADAAGRERLEALVRPYLEPLLRTELAQSGEGAVVVLDAPLVFEWNIQHWFDRVIVVHAGANVAAERVAAGRGIATEEVHARRAAQLAQTSSREGVIAVDNNGSLDDLRSMAREIWNSLILDPDPR